MFLDSPHLRFDGLYVSRNTYIRQGVAEWKREKTCHLVTYFRYFRCAPRGAFACKILLHLLACGVCVSQASAVAPSGRIRALLQVCPEALRAD
jgi:hypothetical protein